MMTVSATAITVRAEHASVAESLAVALPVPAREGSGCAPRSAPTGADAQLLETLRELARSIQLSGPLDLDLGCALIAATPRASLRAHGVALLRAVDASALRPVVFHRRAGGPMAFGEAWLLSLVSALRDGDSDSALFLVGRMIRRERRRVVVWLAKRFAAALQEIEGARR